MFCHGEVKNFNCNQQQINMLFAEFVLLPVTTARCCLPRGGCASPAAASVMRATCAMKKQLQTATMQVSET